MRIFASAGSVLVRSASSDALRLLTALRISEISDAATHNQHMHVYGERLFSARYFQAACSVADAFMS